MFRIGDFSKMTQVTIKALRLYAKLGLLPPAWIDRFSGYRYYDLEQLQQLHRILILKDLGFSLEQIRTMNDSELTAGQLRGMLIIKKAELEETLRKDQERLDRVLNHIAQLEGDGGLHALDVRFKPLPAVRIASLRRRVPSRSAVTAFTKEAQRLILEELRRLRLDMQGGWVLISHDLDYADRNLDLECGKVLEPHRGGEMPGILAPLQLRRLDEVPMAACILNTGGVQSETALSRLFTWLSNNGYRISQPVREVCLDSMEGMEGSQVVEIQAPVISERTVLQPLDSEWIQKELKMDIKFETKPAFTVVGLRYFGKNEHQEIAQMWGEFNRREAEIQHAISGPCYGVCSMPDEANDGAFEYVACVEVSRVDEEHLPEGMVVRHVPAARYAVFEHKGRLNTLGDTYNNIYQKWIPQSGLKLKGGFDMEVYDCKFKLNSDDSIFYIYVSVE